MRFPAKERREEQRREQPSPDLDRLQRSVEEEVVLTLQKKISDFAEECEQVSRSTWSEVSDPPPPPPERRNDVRYTPNGTRVPDDLPSSAASRTMAETSKVSYETVADSRPCRATLGMDYGARDGKSIYMMEELAAGLVPDKNKLYQIQFLAAGLIPDKNVIMVIKIVAAGLIPDRNYLKDMMV